MHKVQALVRLHRQGRSARDAAPLLKISRNTVRSYLTAILSAELLEGSVDELSEMEALKGARSIRPSAGPAHADGSTRSSGWGVPTTRTFLPDRMV